MAGWGAETGSGASGPPAAVRNIQDVSRNVQTLTTHVSTLRDMVEKIGKPPRNIWLRRSIVNVPWSWSGVFFFFLFLLRVFPHLQKGKHPSML